MKRKITFLLAAIAAIMLITQPSKVVGQTRDDVVGTINFGSASGSTKIEGSSSSGTGTVTYTDSGNDSQSNTWTITTITKNTKSFTQNASYSQVGSSSNPVQSITFTMTLPSSQLIKSFSAKFGGFSNTAGTVTLKVGSTTIGSGSLNGTSDVIVENTSTASGTVLTVTVTGIAKGVKCYYVSYTYPTGGTTYDVNISGSISHGTLSADPDEAIEDATVTLTADPEDGYMTNQFTVSKSEGTVTVTKTGTNTGTFKMPAEDVTASVTFVPTHKLSYSATNGTIKFDEGDPVASGYFAFGETLTTSVTATPASGYQFTGWTVTGTGASVENASANPTTFTMGTTDATLTANFVQAITGTIRFGSADGSTKIQGNTSSGTGTVTYTDTGDDSMGNTWTITTVTSNEKSFTQYAEYSQVGAAKKPVTSITFTTTLDEPVEIADFTAKFGGFGDTAGDITLKVGDEVVGTGELDETNDVIVVNESVEEGSVLTVTVTDIAKGVKCYYISFTILTYDYYGSTTITNFIIPADKTLTVHNGAVLNITGTLTNNGTAASLVVEDGGQLIANSVPATVKKSIDKASTKAVSGWYGISSSVHKSDQTYEEMGSVTNLLSGTYDMFYYDEVNSQWINQKATGSHSAYTNMESCKGYIYRNAAAVVLSYEGVTNAGEISQYTLSHTSSLTNDLKGVNLIGNPYPHKIYKSVAFATTSGTATDTLQTGYYVIGGDGSCTATADNVAIDVNQAVLVIATEYANGKTLKFKDRTKAPAGGGSKANNDNIKFMVSNSQYEDVAYALFDKGSGLDKINHRNADIPMIYIPQDDNNYAIAMMSDDTKSFNLNFKAMTMGQYTLQAKTDGNYSYLHIFDRMTGEDIDMLLEGEYSFIASPSDNDSRFIVNLAYNPGSNTVENEIFAYQSGSDIIVNGEGELQVFYITGRRVMTTTINGVESINIPNQGVYIFKLNEKVQKIVVR